VATFEIRVQGGAGRYTYYRDIQRIYGPTTDSTYLYEQGFSTDGPAVGTFFVESGQQRAEARFFERPPTCVTPTPTEPPKPTATATPLPTATPAPPATSTPPPTPTVTPTPDTVGPLIAKVSISPEIEQGESVDANRDLTVQCVVADPSGIQNVVLAFLFTPAEGSAQSGTVKMTPADNLYVATLDPLQEEGKLRFRIEARDRAGNASTSPMEFRDVRYAADY
jgi:hypothetical protein